MSSQANPPANKELSFELDPDLSIPLIMNNLANFAEEKLNLPALCPSLSQEAFLQLQTTVRQFFLNQISISDFQSQMYQAKDHKNQMKKVMECALKEKEMILSLIEVAEKKASEPQPHYGPQPQPQKVETKHIADRRQSKQTRQVHRHGDVRTIYQIFKTGQQDQNKKEVCFSIQQPSKKEARRVAVRNAPEPLQQSGLKKAYVLGDSPSVVFHQQSQPLLLSARQAGQLSSKVTQSSQQKGNKADISLQAASQSLTKHIALSSASEINKQVEQGSSIEQKKVQDPLVCGKEPEKKKPDITEEQSSSKLELNEQAAQAQRNEEKQSIVSSQITGKKVKCKFYPDCKNKDCKFFHPTVKCEHFPKCKFGNSCIYIHPPCRFGSRCTRRDCFYTHPKSNFHSKSKYQQVQLIPKALRGIIDDLATQKRKALLKSKQEKQVKS